jgi:hypothetical protein
MKVLVTILVLLGMFVQAFGCEAGSRLRWPWAHSYFTAWLAGAAFQLVACALYLRLKGRPAWYGILGVLGIFGVMAVIFMDKKCLRCQRVEKHPLKACGNCGAPL